MKARNLFLSLFAFAALCACNKEAQPEVPQILDADTYIKVNIMATDASTRAGYEYGVDDENEVKNALFVFYDNLGNYITKATPTITGGSTETDPNNIAKTLTVKLPAKKTKPSKMLVVLNYNSETRYDDKTLSTAKGLVMEDLTESSGGFTMTNSVYADNSSNIICEVNLVDANFGKTNAENGQADAVTPVNVYVERVAAKVTFDAEDLNSGIVSTTVTVDGTPGKIINPVVKGYNVIDTPTASHDFKAISTSWTYSASKGSNTPAWNNYNDFRSYWASMPDAAEYEYTAVKYDDVAIESPEVQPSVVYVHENTSAKPTKVILAAELQMDGVAVDLVRYNDTYYTLDDFKTLAIEQVQSLDDVVTITAAMLEPVSGTAVDIDNGYEMVLQLNDIYTTATGTKASEINTALKTMSALYWNQGRCYYYTEIKHDLYSGDEQLSGVVRNHVYQLNLKGVKGLGVPVADPEEPIVPETPSDEFYSLNATINILQWKVVGQDVVFGE